MHSGLVLGCFGGLFVLFYTRVGLEERAEGGYVSWSLQDNFNTNSNSTVTTIHPCAPKFPVYQLSQVGAILVLVCVLILSLLIAHDVYWPLVR